MRYETHHTQTYAYQSTCYEVLNVAVIVTSIVLSRKFNEAPMNLLRFLYIMAVLALYSCNRSEEAFELRSGDLLFSVGSGNSELLAAIQVSTSEKEEVPFSHVGIVSVEQDHIYVIEATSPEGVVRRTLDDFFDEAASLEGKKLIAVGRLHPEWQYTISPALEAAVQYLGKEYDYLYDESNDAYYCSELVRKVFIDSAGNPIFEPLAMSFKNKVTGETDHYWTEHFSQRNSSVPEGEPGTNPADMARSGLIQIVHTYY